MNLNNSTSCYAHAKLFDVTPVALTRIIALIFLNILIVSGNSLVVAAVVATKKLRTLTYYLIASLAVADLMIGATVLPFSTSIQMYDQSWLFGKAWCQIWLAIDVWMCTASIYNLTAIGIDRFVAVVKPLRYPSIITPVRGKVLIASAWILPFAICFPPMVVQWPDIFANEMDGFVADCQCTPMDNSPAYIVYSAAGSFFVPMAVIVCLYIRIYGTVRRSTKSMLAGYVNMGDGTSSALRIHQGRSVNASPALKTGSRGREGHRVSEPSTLLREPPSTPPRMRARHSLLHIGVSANGSASTGRLLKRVNKECFTAAVIALSDYSARNSAVSLDDNSAAMGRYSLTDPDSADRIATVYFRKCRANFLNYQKKMRVEVRAAKTVAVVTGCFIFCWLGFSIIYLLKAFPFCRSNNCIPSIVFDVCFWLGYLNSALNPFIYAVLNNEFRRAFKNLLFCNHELNIGGKFSVVATKQSSILHKISR